MHYGTGPWLKDSERCCLCNTVTRVNLQKSFLHYYYNYIPLVKSFPPVIFFEMRFVHIFVHFDHNKSSHALNYFGFDKYVLKKEKTGDTLVIQTTVLELCFQNTEFMHWWRIFSQKNVLQYFRTQKSVIARWL